MLPTWPGLPLMLNSAGSELIGWVIVCCWGRKVDCRFWLNQWFGVTPRRLSEVMQRGQSVHFCRVAESRVLFGTAGREQAFVRCCATVTERLRKGLCARSAYKPVVWIQIKQYGWRRQSRHSKKRAGCVHACFHCRLCRNSSHAAFAACAAVIEWAARGYAGLLPANGWKLARCSVCAAAGG